MEDLSKMASDDFVLKLKEVRRQGMTYDQMRQVFQPYLDEMNRRSAVLHKQFGKRFKPLTFAYLMR